MAFPVFFPTNRSPNVLLAIVLLAAFLATYVHLQTLDNEMIELQRDKLCKQYGRYFAAQPSMWPEVKQQCIRRVFETKSWMVSKKKGSNTTLASLSADMVHHAEKAYFVCEANIEQPCDDVAWANIKACLRGAIPPEMNFDTIKNSTRSIFSLYARFNRCTKELVKKSSNV